MKLNDKPASVASLLEGAKGYLAALEVLARHLNRQLIQPIGLLASQALELALKAVLLNSGRTEDDLREKIRHDLKTAQDEAKKERIRQSPQ